MSESVGGMKRTDVKRTLQVFLPGVPGACRPIGQLLRGSAGAVRAVWKVGIGRVEMSFHRRLSLTASASLPHRPRDRLRHHDVLRVHDGPVQQQRAAPAQVPPATHGLGRLWGAQVRAQVSLTSSPLGPVASAPTPVALLLGQAQRPGHERMWGVAGGERAVLRARMWSSSRGARLLHSPPSPRSHPSSPCLTPPCLNPPMRSLMSPKERRHKKKSEDFSDPTRWVFSSDDAIAAAAHSSSKH